MSNLLQCHIYFGVEFPSVKWKYENNHKHQVDASQGVIFHLLPFSDAEVHGGHTGDV